MAIDNVTREAEQAVLGSLILVPKKFWDIDLATTDFLFPDHALTYGIICELIDDGETKLDPLVLEDRIRGKHGITAEKIIGWTNSVSTTENIVHYAQLVKQKALDREVRKRAFHIYKSHEEGDQLLAEAQRLLLEFETEEGDSEPKSAQIVTGEVIAEMERRRRKEKPSGLSTGIFEFDRYLTLEKGGVLVAAGRPSMGKTAFTRWLIKRALGQGERVLLFSTESHRRTYMTQLLSEESGVNSRAILGGSLGWEKAQLIKEAADRVRGWPLWIDDMHYDIADIVRQIRRFKSRHGITMIVVDHLQEVSNKHSRDSQDAVNRIMVELRCACRESPKTYLVVVSQLNRQVESRENKKPIIADLRASGKIEEVADGIILLYRKYYYYSKADPEILEVCWGKNRDGPTGILEFLWNHQHGHCKGPLIDAETDRLARQTVIE